MEVLLTSEGILSLLTLTFMEVVLGIDNIIFISIAANKLEEKEQPKARNIGLILAMALRLLLLLGISFLIAMNKELFRIDWDWLNVHGGFSGQALILIAGGLFLLYKSTTEIFHKVEGAEIEGHNVMNKTKKTVSTLSKVIIQICLINIVFSFDSILTAIGMTTGIEGAMTIMVVSVILSVVIMMLFAGPVGRFVNKHPSIQMLGLSFLILIGFLLIAEGLHMAHVIEGSIPKGYLYFAIAFSLAVEFLNMKMRKRNKAMVIPAHTQHEEIKEG